MVKITLGKKQGIQQSNNKIPTDNIKPTNQLSDLGRRLKVLEERYTNLRTRFQVTEQNMLSKNKNFFSDIKTINIEMTEVKKEINEVKDNVLNLIKELQTFAKKEDVEMLKKYIDLWNPVNFVTKNDVKDIVEETIDEMKSK